MDQDSSERTGWVVLDLEIQPFGGWVDEVEEEQPEIARVIVTVSEDDADRFPDPVGLVLELDLDNEDESNEATDALIQQVIEFVEQWFRSNSVQPIGDIETAVGVSFLTIDVMDRSTETQRSKFDQFNEFEDADEIFRGLLSVLSCTDLADEDLGETWGITLCPDDTILVRVNAGSRVLSEVWRSARGVVYRIMVVGEFEVPEHFGDAVILRSGFETVEDSMMISALADQLEEVLDIPGVADRVAAHAGAGGRKLPRTNWHNPMSEIFYFSVD